MLPHMLRLNVTAGLILAGFFSLVTVPLPLCAADGPAPSTVQPVKLLTVPSYCEGVVFDNEGRGYISWGKSITQFTQDGKHHVWAETGSPNGHKILTDGTHLVCDASHHAILHLSVNGKPLPHASTECDGKPLRAPNDLTLDPQNGGFYVTDPGDSSKDRPDGTVHYVDAASKTHLVDGGYAYSNGIVLTPNGKRLYVAESQENRVWVYDVISPGKVANKKLFANLPVKDPATGQIDNQPDGMCLDRAGNLYVAHYGMRQVQVLSPAGKLVARYSGGNLTTSNVAFGGTDGGQLFVTGALGDTENHGGLFRLEMNFPTLTIEVK